MKVRYSVDAASAIKAERDLQAAQERTRKGADDQAKAFGRADAESRRFLRAAETSQQKYNRQLSQTNELVQRGVITQRQASQAAQRFRQQFEKADPAIKAARAEQGKLLEQGRRIARELETPTERYKREVLALGKVYRQGAIDQKTLARGMQQLKGELRDATGETAAFKKKQQEAAEALKQAEVEQRRLLEAGKRIARELETPTERYKRSVLELNQTYRKGAIDQRTFVRGVAKLKTELKSATGETARLEREQKDAAKAAEELKRKAAAIVRDNETPLERFRRQYRDLNRLYRQGAISLDQKRRAATRLRGELEGAGAAGKRAFGPAALQSVLALGAGYVSANQALQLGVDLLREQARLREEAARRARDARRGFAELSQLAATAATTPDGRRQAQLDFEQEAKSFRAAGASESLDEAAREVFKLASASLSRSDRSFARDIQAAGAVNQVGDAAKAFASLQTRLGPSAPGSFEDFLDQIIQSSSIAPSLAPEIPLAASRAGGSAGALGLRSEFLLASTAILAKGAGSASEGGTQLAAFLKGLEKDGLSADPSLAGLSGVELVREIGGRNLNRGQLAELVGDRQEAIEGLRTLIKNVDELEAQANQIRQADVENLARQTAGLATVSDQQRAAFFADRAQGTKEVAELDSGRLTNLMNSVLDERAANRAAGNESVWGDLLGDFVARGAEFINTREGVLRRALRESESGRQPLPEDLMAEIRDALRLQTPVLEGIQRNTESAAAQPTGPAE
ncbi:MAG: phage tail tape measure protein [Planctomycetota bacterium]